MPETIVEKTARLRILRLARDAARPPIEDRYYPVIGLDDELPFGKHKGEALRDVIEADPGWVRWALENIATFEVSDEADAELREHDYPRRPSRAWGG